MWHHVIGAPNITAHYTSTANSTYHLRQHWKRTFNFLLIFTINIAQTGHSYSSVTNIRNFRSADYNTVIILSVPRRTELVTLSPAGWTKSKAREESIVPFADARKKMSGIICRIIVFCFFLGGGEGGWVLGGRGLLIALLPHWMYSIKSEEIMSHAFRRSVYKNGGELKPNDLSRPWKKKKKNMFPNYKGMCASVYYVCSASFFFHLVYYLNNAFAPWENDDSAGWNLWWLQYNPGGLLRRLYLFVVSSGPLVSSGFVLVLPEEQLVRGGSLGCRSLL